MSLMILFFSHTAKKSSCGVGTGFCGKNLFDLIDQKSNENERILIIEAKINEDNFIVSIFIALITSLNN